MVYELSENEINAMKALAEFIDEAFAGYGGDAAKHEERMAMHLAWVCEDFFNLIIASAEQQAKYRAENNK